MNAPHRWHQPTDMPDKHLTSRETATAQPSWRRVAAPGSWGTPDLRAHARSHILPRLPPLNTRQSSAFSLQPSAFILRSPPCASPSVVPNPKPISRIQVCGSDGTSPSHKTHLHFVCFVCFVVKKTPPSIRAHPCKSVFICGSNTTTGSQADAAQMEPRPPEKHVNAGCARTHG